MTLCETCRKRTGCKEVCEKAESIIKDSDGDVNHLVFVNEPREYFNPEDIAVFEPRLSDKEDFIAMFQRAFRPLAGVNWQTALVFIGKFYFDMSHDDLCDVFKLKRRRVYDILQRAQEGLAGVQIDEALPEPGGDTGEGGGKQENDMPEVPESDEVE